MFYGLGSVLFYALASLSPAAIPTACIDAEAILKAKVRPELLRFMTRVVAALASTEAAHADCPMAVRQLRSLQRLLFVPCDGLPESYRRYFELSLQVRIDTLLALQRPDAHLHDLLRAEENRLTLLAGQFPEAAQWLSNFEFMSRYVIEKHALRVKLNNVHARIVFLAKMLGLDAADEKCPIMGSLRVMERKMAADLIRACIEPPCVLTQFNERAQLQVLIRRAASPQFKGARVLQVRAAESKGEQWLELACSAEHSESLLQMLQAAESGCLRLSVRGYETIREEGVLPISCDVPVSAPAPHEKHLFVLEWFEACK